VGLPIASRRQQGHLILREQPMFRSGRHFLQLPGPTNVPDRILRAMDRATIDHRGPEFGEMGLRILEGLRELFRAATHVFLYPAAGSGSWEAAVVNTLSPGDLVVGYDSGFFAQKWTQIARDVGLEVETLPSDWRRAVDPAVLEERLRADAGGRIKAVLVVHNETSTGVTNDLPAIREVLDRVGHPALFMVDAVSSLCATELRHDDWGVDVTISGSQKGLMLPPGLSFAAVSPKALEAHATAGLGRSYWDWSAMLRFNETGYFPYTPATGLMYGLEEALRMFEEEGLENTFARHARFGEATRRAVAGWRLENYCIDPSAFSNAITAVLMPEGVDADEVRRVILDRFDMSLGTGLGQVKGRVFRIGHLGDLNDLTLAGTLSGVEMGLALAGVPHEPGGVRSALDYLAEVE
jgi:alanine-glyoxylate transaminase/serine-glyoxylate transaminase/serine-pyruvate transaminase